MFLNMFKKKVPVMLGRWNINHDTKHLERVVYLANHDHCGPCGIVNDVYKKTLNIDKDEKNKTKDKQKK